MDDPMFAHARHASWIHQAPDSWHQAVARFQARFLIKDFAPRSEDGCVKRQLLLYKRVVVEPAVRAQQPAQEVAEDLVNRLEDATGLDLDGDGFIGHPAQGKNAASHEMAQHAGGADAPDTALKASRWRFWRRSRAVEDNATTHDGGGSHGKSVGWRVAFFVTLYCTVSVKVDIYL